LKLPELSLGALAFSGYSPLAPKAAVIAGEAAPGR